MADEVAQLAVQGAFEGHDQGGGAAAHLGVVVFGGGPAQGVEGRLADGLQPAAGRLALLERLAAELADEAGHLVGGGRGVGRPRGQEQGQRPQQVRQVHRGASQTRRVRSAPPDRTRPCGPNATAPTCLSWPRKR